MHASRNTLLQILLFALFIEPIYALAAGQVWTLSGGDGTPHKQACADLDSVNFADTSNEWQCEVRGVERTEG